MEVEAQQHPRLWWDTFFMLFLVQPFISRQTHNVYNTKGKFYGVKQNNAVGACDF